MKSILSAAVAFLAFTGIAAAAGQAPVAVVEDVQGKVTGVQFMDYVVPGQVIKLGEGGMVTLSYMKSCWRETISGIGTVLVGTDQSSVHLSQFKADKVPCDPSEAERISKQSSESAATVVRSLNVVAESPPLVLHGQSPMVVVSERGKLEIERLDVKGERHEVDLTMAPLTRGRFYDLAKANIALTPGGTYSIVLNSKSAKFVVAADAKPGASPVIGRLVSLQ
jgi:hypothetical protein